MAGFFSKLIKDVVSDVVSNVVSDVANNAGQNLAQKLNDGVKIDVPMEDGTVKTATLRAKNAESKVKTAQFEYEITKQDTIRLLACVGEPMEDIRIPDTIDGKPVTIIGESCFAHVVTNHITCPDTVEVIEARAFQKCSVKTIILSKRLKTIKEAAFNNTSSLEYLHLPDTVTSLGSGAFFACGAKRLTLSKGLTAIPEGCFRMCNATEIKIPGNIKTIGEEAFANGRGLSYITLEEGVETIGARAFADCPNLSLVTIPDSVVRLDFGMIEGSEQASFQVSNMNHPALKDIPLNERIGKVSLSMVAHMGNAMAGNNLALAGNMDAESLARAQVEAMKAMAADESAGPMAGL